jgi:hypothetical protein
MGVPFSIWAVLRVEGFAEFHDVQAALTERGADGGDYRPRPPAPEASHIP